MKKELSDQLAKHLSDMTSTSPTDWFFVNKARFGMELVFRTLAEVRGQGTILTQSFTCVTAINPILAAGHQPEFIDISADTLSIDTTKLPTKSKALAVMMQHSFGIPAAADGYKKFVESHNPMLLIEDSAHACGLMVKDEQGEPLADISIHSFGVEKMLATKFGAAVWISPKLDSNLRRQLIESFDNLPEADKRTSWKMRSYKIENRIFSHLPTFFRQAATKLDLFEPAVHKEELAGENTGTACQPSDWVIAKILDEFKKYPQNLADRASASELYTAKLADILEAPAGLANTPTPVRYPLYCQSAQQAQQLFTHLTNQGYYVGKWYRPTLFPGVKDAKIYNYDKTSCPVAEDLSARIINLPTNVNLETAKEISNVIRSQIIR